MQLQKGGGAILGADIHTISCVFRVVHRPCSLAQGPLGGPVASCADALHVLQVHAHALQRERHFGVPWRRRHHLEEEDAKGTVIWCISSLWPGTHAASPQCTQCCGALLCPAAILHALIRVTCVLLGIIWVSLGMDRTVTRGATLPHSDQQGAAVRSQ